MIQQWHLNVKPPRHPSRSKELEEIVSRHIDYLVCASASYFVNITASNRVIMIKYLISEVWALAFWALTLASSSRYLGWSRVNQLYLETYFDFDIKIQHGLLSAEH
jgi:hypothetical protein